MPWVAVITLHCLFSIFMSRAPHRMRSSGVYSDEKGDGGRWELAQALRWAVMGEIFNAAEGTWNRSSRFGGFGLKGGDNRVVLKVLLDEYAPMHWRAHGKMRSLVGCVDRLMR